jgi:hypothetical protein
MDELVEMGWSLLDKEVATLQEDGCICMKFFVVSDNRFDVVMSPQPEVANDPEAKEAIFALVKSHAREHSADAVCVLSDVYIGHRSMKDLPKEKLDQIMEVGMLEAERRGLIKKREALIMSISTRLQTVMLVQYYRREENKGKERIVLEEKELKDSPGTGRLASFFDDIPMGHA